MKWQILAALITVLAVAVAPAPEAQGRGTATVEVRVLQNVNADEDIHVRARSVEDSWRSLLPLPLDDGFTSGGRFRYGDITLAALLPGGAAARVEVRVWQGVDNAGSVYLSARPVGGSWATLGTIRLALDDGFTSNRRFRYDDVALEVPLPEGADPAASTAEDIARPLPTATIEFDGGFSATEQATIRAEWQEEFARTVAFFADDYGLVVPGLRIRVMRDTVANLDRLGYASKTMFLAENLKEAILHEYVHALQDHLSTGTRSPRWIEEGVAIYFTGRHFTARGRFTYDRFLDSGLANSRRAPGPLRTLVSNIARVDGFKYSLGFVAANYLAAVHGEHALLDFDRQLSVSPDWRAAFQGAFGMSVGTFYRDFASYRAGVAPPLYQIRGVVLDPDGDPAEEIIVWAERLDGRETWLDGILGNGTFSVPAANGSHRLLLGHRFCGTVGFLDGEGGVTRFKESAKPIVVDGADVTNTVITLPVDSAQRCTRTGPGWWEWWRSS